MVLEIIMNIKLELIILIIYKQCVMKMRFLIFMIIFTLFSCNNKDNNSQQKSKTLASQNVVEQKIVLGENIPEINAYAKNIYKKNDVIYIELDLVEIKYKNVDDRIIVNNNPKIRTYVIDNRSLIYSNDCKEISASELFKIKEKLLKDHSIIVVGTSENGRMKSINFGCYG